jgi:CRISPR-associated protein Csb1
MADIKIEDLLKEDGPVAIIVKQPLSPVDEDDRVIFPPTYPMTQWNGRVHTIRDGDYRVTVELPSGSKADKDEKKENQKPSYQIDRFPDGTNICEIDSPQSQSNRIEPRFKTIEVDRHKLVPQVEIQVGTEKVNLLDVGHRAGDAVVRMSSLAADIHEAFTAAKSRDFFKLARIAPTSLVFGVWDSRSTYVKQQRVFKAHIRATNVREVSRSAQYTPATAYVDAGAIGEDVERKTGDESNLSQEGMVHALSTQSVGGVMLTDNSRLVRTVNINLAAIRALRGTVPTTRSEQPISEAHGQTPGMKSAGSVDGTKALQEYILGLALVAAFDEPDLNLREGCHLRYKDGEESSIKLIYRSKPSGDCPFGDTNVLDFANTAKSKFFKLAGNGEQAIDRRDVVFERGVAEKFLAYSQSDRNKIRKLGPITAARLARFEAQGKDPFKAVTDELKNVKNALGKKPGKMEPPVKNIDAFKTLGDVLDSLSNDETLPKGAADLASNLAPTAREHVNSHEAFKSIDVRIKEFKKAMKEGAGEQGTASGTETQE